MSGSTRQCLTCSDTSMIDREGDSGDEECEKVVDLFMFGMHLMGSVDGTYKS